MKKTKVLFILFLTLIVGIYCYTTKVQAEVGGTGSIGGGGSGSIGGTSSVYHDCGLSDNRRAYFMELVYYDGKNRTSIASTVALVSTGASSNYIDAVKTFANSKTTTKKIFTSGPFYNLASKINNGTTIESLERSGWLDKNFSPELWMNDLGVNQAQLTKPHEKPYGINKKGYRIMVQKLVAWCQNGKVTKAYPRKMMAAEGYNTANGDGDFLGTGKPASAESDIWTTRADIGVKSGSQYSWSKANFADWNKGIGYHIIWFPNPYSNPGDYSVDAACENCDSKNTNGSYIIQDTNDWDAILRSGNSQIQNAKTYYKVSGQNAYCREEYKVIFPNANNQITTEAGRFFTINKMGGAMYASGIPNLKQIKVQKIRECRSEAPATKACLDSGKSEVDCKKENQQSVLQSSINKDGLANETGNVALKYNEKVTSKYSGTNLNLTANENRTVKTGVEYINSVVNESQVMARVTTTKYYELPQYTYQYVRIRDNIAMKTKPTSGLEHYHDMEVENLPVSVKNYSDNNGGAEVILKYSLPSNSKLSKSFNTKNDYFKNPDGNSVDNIYKKYINGGLNDSETAQLKISACAKLYGYGTASFKTCASQRQTNKSGDCLGKINQDNQYVCNIKTCPEGEILCDENTCSTDGKCPGNERECKFLNGIYYGPNGEVLDPQTLENFQAKCPNTNICRISNGKYYGNSGKEVTRAEYLVECPQVCRVVDGKYYGKKGQLITKKQYEIECPGNNDFCRLCNGGKCCPDLDMVCPDMNGECPGRGNRIIYRPIDLTNPFPGQTNYQRATGGNWCTYNMKTGKTTCKNTNAVVTSHITNNRSSANEDVYSLNPLYEVELDATTIKKIKEYNKTNHYDDFTLNCPKGSPCYSTWLREKSGLTISGECSKQSSLSTCAERGRS